MPRSRSGRIHVHYVRPRVRSLDRARRALRFAASHRSDGSRPGDEALLVQEARLGKPDRLSRRGWLPGRAPDAGSALQTLAALRRREAPVGASPGGPDRRRHRASRLSLADRREVGDLQGAVRPVQRPRRVHARRWTEGRATPGAAARNARTDSPRGLPRDHEGSSVRGAGDVGAARAARQALVADVRPARRAASTRAHRTAGARGRQVRRRVWRRDDVRRRTAAFGRHRQPHERLRGPRSHGKGGCQGSGDHRNAARQPQRRAQQLPGLPGVPVEGRQDRLAARHAVLRRVRAQSVPDRGRDRADARRETRRGRRDQGLRRARDARHVGS